MPPDGRSRRQIFQFTPLREGRHTAIIWRWMYRSYFNSRPSARGDARRKPSSRRKQFQFTPLREGRRGTGAIPPRRWLFQFTPLREGRPFATSGIPGVGKFQFTPLREGRRIQSDFRKRRVDFNSRPSARGDARVFEPDGVTVYKFQFTPLREGRQGLPHHIRRAGYISIHAPPRGATIRLLLHARIPSYFNSRPSARGDLHLFPRLHLCRFQFTPLREGRRARLCQSPASYQFQFTPLREGRPKPLERK